MKYIFKTQATMKEYNAKKWWISSNIIPEMEIESDSVKNALKEYQKKCTEEHYISVSDNAIKTKRGMYTDTKSGEMKQIGYVITGKTEFEDRDKRTWSTQYIDLWVEIITVVDTEF